MHSRNVFENGRALVVGSHSSIAFAVLQELVRRGVNHIVGTYLPRDKKSGVGIKNVQRQMNEIATFTPMQLDQTNESQIERVVKGATEFMGGLDLLVTAASLQTEEPYLEVSGKQTRAEVLVNLFGPMEEIRQAALIMMQLVVADKRERAIGVINSVRGIEPLAPTGYDAAKAGMVHHIRAMAPILGPHKISIVGVAPGTVDCPIEHKRHGVSQKPDRYRKRWAPLTPLGGTPVTPKMVAKVLCDLMAAPGVTGTVVPVDGGFTHMRPTLRG